MSSIIDKAFSIAYNEAAELYDKDELDACIEKANEIINDNATPRYHRMKTWILLGSCLGDWEEAHDCYVKAQSMWTIVRRYHPVGEDEGVDGSLEELRVDLKELEEALAKDKPAYYNFDHETIVADAVAAHEQAVLDEIASNEHIDEQEAREAAEKKKAEEKASLPPPSIHVEAPAGSNRVPIPAIPQGETSSSQLYPRPASRRLPSRDRTEEIMRKPSWRSGGST